MSPRSLALRARTPFIILASIGVFAAAVMVGGTATPVAAPTPRPTAEPTPEPIEPFTPVSFHIPKIELNAPVVPVGTEADGKMGAPKTAHEVGWWAGRKPGEGNVLLDGHHDWSGKLGSFYGMKDLVVGDTVTIKGEGDKPTATYKIIWIKDFDRTIDATDLLGNETGKQIATLITCTGVFSTIHGTRDKRLVARAEYVGA